MSDTDAYAAIARELVEPSPKQTIEFATFVSEAHSWYKHLPAYPSVPFVFYLDPNAGRNMAHSEGGQISFVDVSADSKEFHYTWQPTAVYRRRFGFWNYQADYGTSFRYVDGDQTVDTAGAGLRILDTDTTWLEIPTSLCDAGTVLVNSLVWPIEKFIGGTVTEGLLDLWVLVGEERLRIRKTDESALHFLPSELVAAIFEYKELVEGEPYKEEKRRVFEKQNRFQDEFLKGNIIDKLFKRIRASRWKALWKSEAYKTLTDEAEETWKQTSAHRKEKEIEEVIKPFLKHEQQRQIEAMVDSMNKFVEALTVTNQSSLNPSGR